MIVKFNNVSLSVKNGKKIVENLSLILHPGDKLCLIGEEGNGKSTLLKFINNTQDIEAYCEFQGEVICDGSIGYLPQFMDKEWNRFSVLDYLMSEHCDSDIDYSYYDNYLKIEKLFTEFSILEILKDNREIGLCSGGEKIKIQLIKILLRHPSLLLLDEPTNDLDLITLTWMEEYLVSFKFPIIFVSHDERFISRLATSILHIEHIKRKTETRTTLYSGSYRLYLQEREKKFAKQARDHIRTVKAKEEKKKSLMHQHQLVENGLNNAVRNPVQGRLLAKKMKNILSQEKKLDKMKIVPEVAREEEINCFFPDEIAIFKSKRLIDIQGAELTIGSRLLISRLELKVYGPTHLVITGPNGSGKSTLMKFLLGAVEEGPEIKIGYMPQDYNTSLDLNITPIEHLQSVLGYDNATLSTIMCFLGAMRFVDAEMQSRIDGISGGQQAKLFLLTLIMTKCNVLFLDEPTRNLSPLSNPKIRAILKNFKGAIIAVSHDREFIDTVGDQVYRIEDQRLIKVK